MQIRRDRGWVTSGWAVLARAVLGAGVLATACGTDTPRPVTAEGVTAVPSGGSGAEPAGASARAGGPRPSAAPLGAPPGSPADGKKSGPAVGDKVPVGDDGGSVTVSALQDNVPAERLLGAGDGNRYVAAEVKGCSGPDERNLTFEPAYFRLVLDDGTVASHGVPAKRPSLAGGPVPAGKCLSGWVTFAVKEGALPAAVIYDGSSRLTWTVPLPKNAKPTTSTTMTMTTKPPATTTTGDGTGGSKPTTSSTKPKTTSTTARTTATTADQD